MKNLLTKDNLLKVGIPLVIAVVAYLNQVDPLSLCKPVSLPALQGAVSQPLTADAGN